MNQSQNIKIPTPLHAQLKALAVKRGTTMVDIIHGVVRDAISTGELPDETPGFRIVVDFDRLHLPITIQTNAGDFPEMNHKDAFRLADALEKVAPTDLGHFLFGDEGGFDVSFVGTGVAITGKSKVRNIDVKVVVTPAIAQDLGRQLRTVVKSLAN